MQPCLRSFRVVDSRAALQRTGMAADIAEAPAVIEQLFHDRGAIASLADAIRNAQPAWVTIVARGSSDHVAIYLQYLLESYCGLPTGLAVPSASTIYGAQRHWAGGLLVAISQSGESPDVSRLVEEARLGGALTAAITNRPASPVAQAAEHVLDCMAGDERAIPATKTYAACLAVAAMLVAELAPGTEVAEGLPALPAAIESAIEASGQWLDDGSGTDLLEELAGADRALVISRGYNLATAYETALKLKEACGLFATGYSSADVLHGPMVVAVPGVPLLAFRPDGPIGRSVDEAIGAAQQRGIGPWLVGGHDLGSGPRTLRLAANLPEVLTPLPYAIMGQVLSERLAFRLRMNPDAPQGLTKVTRTL